MSNSAFISFTPFISKVAWERHKWQQSIKLQLPNAIIVQEKYQRCCIENYAAKVKCVGWTQQNNGLQKKVKWKWQQKQNKRAILFSVVSESGDHLNLLTWAKHFNTPKRFRPIASLFILTFNMFIRKLFTRGSSWWYLHVRTNEITARPRTSSAGSSSRLKKGIKRKLTLCT